MSLFRKPKKHIQRRVFSSNEDDEIAEHRMEVDEEEKTNTLPVAKVKAEKKPEKKGKQTLLSFGDEEEGEVFQVKKSSHSKKIMRLLDKERRKKKEDRPEGGEEIKVKTEEKRTEIITGDLVMVVKSTESPRILNGRAARCAGREDVSGSDEEAELAPRHRFSHPDTVRIVLESGKIPDAAMIHAARKRRQRARELGGDFVPLEEPPEKDKGRLVREDQDSDEERIDMGANPAVRDRDMRRQQFFAAQDQESEPDTDKEMEEWENQQIRKGVTGAQVSWAWSERSWSYDAEMERLTGRMLQLMAASQEAAHGPTGATHLREETPKERMKPVVHEPGVPRTPETIVGKLRERLEAVRESRETHESSLERVTSERDSAELELHEHEERAPKAAQRFRFYQELRGYVTDLVECLDEKVSVITDLEQRALELSGRQAERLCERRRQDVRDQAEEVATAAAQYGGLRRAADDETRVRRAAEREGRRSRRRRAREGGAHPRHIEGMSSDDEIPDQELLGYRSQREAIQADSESVFSDVVEDYATVGNILTHFERWRETDSTSYTEAYASLCLPKIVGPLLRLALVFWNPLLEPDDLEKHKWYHTLMLYGADVKDTEDKLSNDPDVALVPTVVDKIILPKLTQLIEKCWDPMSSSQTLRLVGLIGRYIRRYPTLGPESKSLNAVFNAVMDKLRSAVEHDVFIPIFSKQTLESKSPFFQRQFASGLKLLRNVTSWQGLVNDKQLKDLALAALLDRYLLMGMRICQLTDAVAKAGLISHILPRVWLQGDLQQLNMFTTYVAQLASQLDKDNPLHLESIETVTGILKSLRCT